MIFYLQSPGTDVCNSLDNVFLLSYHSQLLYNGPVNKIVEYFENIGYQCPSTQSPGYYFGIFVFIYLFIYLFNEFI